MQPQVVPSGVAKVGSGLIVFHPLTAQQHHAAKVEIVADAALLVVDNGMTGGHGGAGGRFLPFRAWRGGDGLFPTVGINHGGGTLVGRAHQPLYGTHAQP